MNKSELIVGRHPVKEALKSERVCNKLFVQESANMNQMQDIIKRAKEQKVVVQQVPKSKLDHMSNENHQGVILAVSPYEYLSLNELIGKHRESDKVRFFILDGIEDPHNFGSMIRTADAIGMSGFIIPERRSVQVNETVVKTSTGAIEHIDIARVTNLAKAIDTLKKEGFWIVGTDASATDDFRNMPSDAKLAIVIGSEGEGMSRLVKDECDFLIKMPMVGHVNSLNASIATSLIMYELHRKDYPLEG
ncbi:23S rRNA (guanosine(2251)-2'-O)-methyltransferase RlmB [Abyssicoccus albus]|uniref:23S rRNA (guanosine(2251)-2'-O)-methyltransferase RlmB n=1 Tax=Abyssicoccus albus TaxID=1817405 RepID=UPI00097E2FBC|nr:23S rRNA (guanosine(2251)-2'-O)-methyltransferase RlmB [Abyssicoccus albus]AQL56860.1 23S rRNA (guanosine(2251)-2'-O)-methyltransferase RlmB [Abyssicoccus albus]